MSRINIGENVIIRDNKEIHQDCIIIDYVQKLDETQSYLNENNDECLICFNKIKKNYVVVKNNYCKCFHNLVLCDKCFIYWLFMNNYCFICRKTFKIKNKNFLDLFYFINRGLLLLTRINSLNINKNSRRFNHSSFRGTRLRTIRDHTPDVSVQIIDEPILEPIQENRQLSLLDPSIPNTSSNLLHETIVDDIIDDNELREIQVNIANTLSQRRRQNRRDRLQIEHSRYHINDQFLLFFSFFMIFASTAFLLFSFFYRGKII